VVLYFKRLVLSLTAEVTTLCRTVGVLREVPKKTELGTDWAQLF